MPAPAVSNAALGPQDAVPPKFQAEQPTNEPAGAACISPHVSTTITTRLNESEATASSAVDTAAYGLTSRPPAVPTTCWSKVNITRYPTWHTQSYPAWQPVTRQAQSVQEHHFRAGPEPFASASSPGTNPTTPTYHAKLLEKSTRTPDGQWVVSATDAASILELTSTQLDILCEVLGALSILNGANPDRPVVGQEQLYAHEITLFMFVQLFSKESQRAENMEVWPEASPSFSSSMSLGLDGLLSPTRSMTVRTSSSGRAMVRQQLYQNVRHQAQQLKGLGEYLRRNLKALVELALDASGPSTSTLASASSTPPPGSATPGGTAQPHPPAQPQQQRLVSALEVDRLRLIMCVASSPRQSEGPFCPISGLIPGYVLPGALLPLDVVVASLRQLWWEDVVASPRVGATSPAASLLMSPAGKASRQNIITSQGSVDHNSIVGVFKGTVVKGESDLPYATLRVMDCHEAMVYVLAPMQVVYISSCSESTFVIGAAGGMVRLERCERITLIAASARVLVSSCHDCVLHLGTPRPPMLIGDCRFVRLAPYNTRYERQLAHVHAAGLRLDMPNRWDSPLVLAGKERRLGTSTGGTPESPRSGGLTPSRGLSTTTTTFSLLQPDELLPFVVPFQGSSGPMAGGPAPPHATSWRHMARAQAGGEAAGSPNRRMPASTSSADMPYLFPLPPEYERAIHRKLAMTGELRNKFRQAGLTKEREVELNNAIQAYFREWLSTGSMLRQIYDLSNSNLEKDDPGLGPESSLPAGAGGGGGGGGGAGRERVTLNL